MKLSEITQPKSSLSQVEKFLAGPEHNAWLKVETMKVYVRKAGHLIDGNVIDTLDIANVDQLEKQRGKGKFRQLVIDLTKLLESKPDLRKQIKGIYVESVLNDRLAASLPSMGFKPVTHSSSKWTKDHVAPCFYLPLSP